MIIIKQGQRLQLPNDRTTFDGDWKRSCTVEMEDCLFFSSSSSSFFFVGSRRCGADLLTKALSVGTGAMVANRTNATTASECNWSLDFILLMAGRVRNPSPCDGLAARICSRPPMLKVVLGLRATPSQDLRTNLNCVCMNFGIFFSNPPSPLFQWQKMCVRPIPTPAPVPFSQSPSQFLLQQYIGRPAPFRSVLYVMPCPVHSPTNRVSFCFLREREPRHETF